MRSFLFVPGDSDKKIAKGLQSDADALILDLEDAVSEDRKEFARALVADVLLSGTSEKTLIVRINAFDTQAAVSDLASVIRGNPFGIMIPKCGSAGEVKRAGHYLSALEARDGLAHGSIALIPIATETAASVLQLPSYAGLCIDRLYGLLWGGEDLAADIRAASNRDSEGRYSSAFQFARTQCLLAAHAAGANAIDAVFTDFRNLVALKAESQEAARDGFSGKAAIHPDQIAVINEAFQPTARQIEWAGSVLAAFEQATSGVATLDGKMLDSPHRRSAETILQRAASGR